MRMRSLALIAVAAPLLALVPATGNAAVHHRVLTNYRVGGPAVRVGSILTAGLRGRAEFLIPGTRRGVRCRRATVTDRVIRNPAAPGTAVERLIRQTFRRCYSSIPGTTGVRSVRVLHLPYWTTIRSRGKRVTIFNARTRLTLNTVVGRITCSYHTFRLHGRAENFGSRIVFRDQRFRLTSGSLACPRAGSFSATFGPVINRSVRRHPHVFVN